MDVKIATKIDGLKELTRKYPDESQKARVSRITEAVLLLKRAIKLLTPVGAGPVHLRDTLIEKVSTAGIAVSGILGTPAIYGEPVEMGTQPHFPPVAPIQHWVEKKLGIVGKEAKSVAFLIARAISIRGTKGAAMFDKGFSENEAAVVRILEMIPGDIVKQVSN
ncbi:MAG: hypothetical protein WC374_04220 [Phycisphaerae bacterium]|jgi:hypothetical protein